MTTYPEKNTPRGNSKTENISIRGELIEWMKKFPLDLKKPKMRPSWDEYYLMLAFFASRRSSCLRHQIGAIIVLDNRVISTGYNGSPPGSVNCSDLGYCIRDKYNIPSNEHLEICYASGSHAESNAIIRAHQDLKGAVMYLYGHEDICAFCRGLILHSGIKKVVHLTDDWAIKIYNPKDWLGHIPSIEGDKTIL